MICNLVICHVVTRAKKPAVARGKVAKKNAKRPSPSSEEVKIVEERPPG